MASTKLKSLLSQCPGGLGESNQTITSIVLAMNGSGSYTLIDGVSGDSLESYSWEAGDTTTWTRQAFMEMLAAGNFNLSKSCCGCPCALGTLNVDGDLQGAPADSVGSAVDATAGVTYPVYASYGAALDGSFNLCDNSDLAVYFTASLGADVTTPPSGGPNAALLGAPGGLQGPFTASLTGVAATCSKAGAYTATYTYTSSSPTLNITFTITWTLTLS